MYEIDPKIRVLATSKSDQHLPQEAPAWLAEGEFVRRLWSVSCGLSAVLCQHWSVCSVLSALMSVLVCQLWLVAGSSWAADISSS